MNDLDKKIADAVSLLDLNKSWKSVSWENAVIPDNNDILAQYIDHTLLKANAQRNDILNLCEEANNYKFKSICINPFWLELAKRHLKDVDLCTVIGFPLGANTREIKVAECRDALNNGADECDLVMNISAFKSQNYTFVLDEMKEIAGICSAEGKIAKVIIETAYLSLDEIIIATVMARVAGLHFVKTSTGFAGGGAIAEHIKIMRSIVGNNMGVKASGGIRDRKTALDMIRCGASRLGCSASVEIMEGKLYEKDTY